VQFYPSLVLTRVVELIIIRGLNSFLILKRGLHKFITSGLAQYKCLFRWI
jgi:hypothetical protein